MTFSLRQYITKRTIECSFLMFRTGLLLNQLFCWHISEFLSLFKKVPKYWWHNITQKYQKFPNKAISVDISIVSMDIVKFNSNKLHIWYATFTHSFKIQAVSFLVSRLYVSCTSRFFVAASFYVTLRGN